MPRHARKLASSMTYHIVIKGADRQIIFKEPKDYIKYLDFLQYYKEEFGFELYAYCLLSNHVHLLLRHPANTSLENIFRHLNTAYASWFNMKYQRTGFLQGGRYFSEPVDSEQYLLTVLRYIHYNPTKANLEAYPGMKYHWTSFYDYENETPGLVDIDFIFSLLGSKQHFLDLHKIPVEDECFDIHKIRIRITDDIVKDLLLEYCNCKTSVDFQNLSLMERDKSIVLLHKKGASARQINRLTGTPRGVIERVISSSEQPQNNSTP